jgi:uncharacterized RmlC-like cupin family protein
VEFDADGNGVVAAPGGFVLIPAGAPHREGNPREEPNARVISRIGEGPVLEPLDGLPASTWASGRARSGALSGT